MIGQSRASDARVPSLPVLAVLSLHWPCDDKSVVPWSLLKTLKNTYKALKKGPTLFRHFILFAFVVVDIIIFYVYRVKKRFCFFQTIQIDNS